jgi:hypothetical protein
MNRMIVASIAAFLFAFPLACEKEKVPEPGPAAPAPAPAAAATSAASTTAAAPPAAEPENVPVAADFEEEAEKTITRANYKAELDTLEAELKR